jgi:hypothetical protein
VIPPFDTLTGNLLPGVHEAMWADVLTRFGYTPHRLALLAGLKLALDNLRAAGCRRVYIDGSFVTAKEAPHDFDACCLLGSSGRERRVARPGVAGLLPEASGTKGEVRWELFIAHQIADPRTGRRFVEFFQHDRLNNPKGIVALDLGDLP